VIVKVAQKTQDAFHVPMVGLRTIQAHVSDAPFSACPARHQVIVMNVLKVLSRKKNHAYLTNNSYFKIIFKTLLSLAHGNRLQSWAVLQRQRLQKLSSLQLLRVFGQRKIS
jgi:hypothetical protein